MTNVQACSLEGSEFEFQWRYYVHFQTDTFEKGVNLLMPLFMD